MWITRDFGPGRPLRVDDYCNVLLRTSEAADGSLLHYYRILKIARKAVRGRHLFLISVQALPSLHVCVAIGSVQLPQSRGLTFFALTFVETESTVFVRFYDSWEYMLEAYFTPVLFRDLRKPLMKTAVKHLDKYWNTCAILRDLLNHNSMPIYSALRFANPIVSIHSLYYACLMCCPYVLPHFHTWIYESRYQKYMCAVCHRFKDV